MADQGSTRSLADIMAEHGLKPIRTSITPRPWAHSYGLKHWVEKRMGPIPGGDACGGYISNGTLIAAALMLRYPFKVLHSGPNAIFGMSMEDVRKRCLETGNSGISVPVELRRCGYRVAAGEDTGG